MDSALAEPGADPAPAGAASRRDQILAACARLFSEKGFENVGIDEIGALVGVSGPAIYRHFSGKDELLAELFDQGLDWLFENAGLQRADPETELRHLVRVHAEYTTANRELAAVHNREERSLVAPHRERIRAREERYFKRWTECLGRCYPEWSPARRLRAAWCTIGMIQSVTHWPPDLVDSPEAAEDLAVAALGALTAFASDSRS